MLWIVFGLVGMLAGMVAMVMGNMLGLTLLIISVAAMAFNYVTMMRGRGDEPDQGTINGLKGQGKQQSETVKANSPASGEQNPGIWEKMGK